MKEEEENLICLMSFGWKNINLNFFVVVKWHRHQRAQIKKIVKLLNFIKKGETLNQIIKSKSILI